jgi:hypothetical protein
MTTVMITTTMIRTRIARPHLRYFYCWGSSRFFFGAGLGLVHL